MTAVTAGGRGFGESRSLQFNLSKRLNWAATLLRGDGRNSYSVSIAIFYQFMCKSQAYLISSLDSPEDEGRISYIVGSNVCESLEVFTSTKGIDQPSGYAVDSICKVSIGDLAIALVISQGGDWIL